VASRYIPLHQVTSASLGNYQNSTPPMKPDARGNTDRPFCPIEIFRRGMIRQRSIVCPSDEIGTLNFHIFTNYQHNMPNIPAIVLGSILSVAALCCIAKVTLTRMDRPAYVDENYWNERSRRQPQDMAAAWRRSAPDPHAATRVLNHSWGVQTPSSWKHPRSLRGVGDSPRGRHTGRSVYSL
jgi:hypothetical protein